MEKHETILKAVAKASVGWRAAFNRGDGQACAQFYEADAVMHARPFGSFRGREQIAEFWCELIASGAKDVRYIDTQYAVVNDTEAVLTSRWEMNIGRGVIHKEIWVLNGEAPLLREDEFEVLERFEQP